MDNECFNKMLMILYMLLMIIWAQKIGIKFLINISFGKFKNQEYMSFH